MTGRELIDCIKGMSDAERRELADVLPAGRLSPGDRRALDAAWMHVPIGPIKGEHRPLPPIKLDPSFLKEIESSVPKKLDP